MTDPTPPPPDDTDRRERIARLAHQIWESEGRPEGQSLRHWGMAERLVDAGERAGGGAGSSAASGDPSP